MSSLVERFPSLAHSECHIRLEDLQEVPFKKDESYHHYTSSADGRQLKCALSSGTTYNKWDGEAAATVAWQGVGVANIVKTDFLTQRMIFIPIKTYPAAAISGPGGRGSKWKVKLTSLEICLDK